MQKCLSLGIWLCESGKMNKITPGIKSKTPVRLKEIFHWLRREMTDWCPKYIDRNTLVRSSRNQIETINQSIHSFMWYLFRVNTIDLSLSKNTCIKYFIDFFLKLFNVDLETEAIGTSKIK